MHLGLRIKAARLEAGLSQRALCGEEITRNMLSLIENGSARPSMDTLRYLAGRLQKPVSFFLEENPVLSPNQDCMERARSASPEEVLDILQEYREPDPLYDREKYLLEAQCEMALAEDAIRSRKLPYSQSLLQQAEKAGQSTPYFTAPLKRQWVILAAQAGLLTHREAAARLPDCSAELLLRAHAARETGDNAGALALLEAVPQRDEPWRRLTAQVLADTGRYREAAAYLEACTEDDWVLEQLEICCRELGDFEKAYFYACRRRERKCRYYNDV